MGSWDAETYARVSKVQLECGKNILQRRAWKGNETVLDAGCGSGGLTRMLAAKVPRGKVYAVDSDPGMVKRARESLSDFSNVQVIQADLVDVKLPEGVDVVFSNAVLHWVPDHKKAFANFYSLLKGGGELLAQCGGRGNLDSAIAILGRIAIRDPFRTHFAGWKTMELCRPAGNRKAAARCRFQKGLCISFRRACDICRRRAVFRIRQGGGHMALLIAPAGAAPGEVP